MNSKDISDIIMSKNGQIIYNELVYIDFSKNIESQVEELNEDLLQVNFCNDIILDVGWYPSFDVNGSFLIYLIKNADWNEPICFIECKWFEDLKNSIAKAVDKLPPFTGDVF